MSCKTRVIFFFFLNFPHDRKKKKLSNAIAKYMKKGGRGPFSSRERANRSTLVIRANSTSFFFNILRPMKQTIQRHDNKRSSSELARNWTITKYKPSEAPQFVFPVSFFPPFIFV